MKIIYTTKIFDSWYQKLKDREAARFIQVRIDRSEDGNFGDCKPISEGVSEMRLHVGPDYRLYFMQQGLEIVILLAGGNKSSQSRDIEIALQLAREIRESK